MRRKKKKNLRYSQCWRPLLLQNIQTNPSIAIDIAMINFRRERHLRWFERIVRREMNIKEKNSTSIRRIIRPLEIKINIKIKCNVYITLKIIPTMIVACQWNKSSPIGPAEQFAGGSRPSSCSSRWILLSAIGYNLFIMAEKKDTPSRNRSNQNFRRVVQKKTDCPLLSTL